MNGSHRRFLALAGLAFAAWACASGGSSSTGSTGAVLAAAGSASSVAGTEAPKPRVFLGDTLPACGYRATGDMRFTSSLRGTALVKEIGEVAAKAGADGVIKITGPTSTGTSRSGGGGGGRRGGGGGGGSSGMGPQDITGTYIKFSDPGCRK